MAFASVARATNPTVVHLTARHRLCVTIEDATRTNSMGTAITLACADATVRTPIRVLGLPPAFIDTGDRDALLQAHQLTEDHITTTIETALKPTKVPS